jgi:hypothetical protein
MSADAAFSIIDSAGCVISISIHPVWSAAEKLIGALAGSL